MSEDETTDLQPEEIDSKIDSINEDIDTNEKIINTMLERMKGQLETNNILLEDPNHYPALLRYGKGIAIIMFALFIFYFEIFVHYRDPDLY